MRMPDGWNKAITYLLTYLIGIWIFTTIWYDYLNLIYVFQFDGSDLNQTQIV